MSLSLLNTSNSPLLAKYLRQNGIVSTDAINQISAHFNTQAVQKGTILLHHGAECDKLYFINLGCMRTYYLTEQGATKTRLLATEGMIISSLGSFISAQPLFEVLEAMEDSEVLFISRIDFYDLLEALPEWRQFYTHLLELAYLFQNKKIEQLVTLSAHERYTQLLKDRPDLVNRVSNKVLASYLDITQETLSRLKSR